MPQGVNRVILVGFLGRDPDIRAMPSGATVANFDVATSERFRPKDGPQKTVTEWHKVAAFGRVADVVRLYRLQKGVQVYVEGSLRTRKWQDKTGQNRWTTEIVAREVLLIGGAEEAPESPTEPPEDIPW